MLFAESDQSALVVGVFDGVLAGVLAGVPAGVVVDGVLVGLLLVSEELGVATFAVESPLLVDSLPLEVAVAVALDDEDLERLSVL